MGLDPQDPATTWHGSVYEPPRDANHEANANNRWHLTLLLLIGVVLLWRASQGRDREKAIYAAAIVCAFVAFSAYLKWQPFLARLFLPLYVVAAPLAGIVGEIRTSLAALAAQTLLCLFLLDNARLPLVQNWVRPLTGPASIFHTPRDNRYFADMQPWNNRESYVKSANLIGRTPCNTVGIDINNFQLEYPLMALVRERRPAARFMHTAVTNPSRSYPPPVETQPCVVACLDCSEDAARLNLYAEFKNRRSLENSSSLSRRSSIAK